MYLYTLAFLKYENTILLLNRNKKPWKGSWNGVGGKRQGDETPLECVIREIHEETTLHVTPSQVQDCGILTWTAFDAIGTGLHLFLVELDACSLQTPLKTEEGILDWKDISWIVDLDNQGIAQNIPYFLPTILRSKTKYHFHCTFENKHLVRVEEYPYVEPMI